MLFKLFLSACPDHRLAALAGADHNFAKDVAGVVYEHDCALAQGPAVAVPSVLDHVGATGCRLERIGVALLVLSLDSLALLVIGSIGELLRHKGVAIATEKLVHLADGGHVVLHCVLPSGLQVPLAPVVVYILTPKGTRCNT